MKKFLKVVMLLILVIGLYSFIKYYEDIEKYVTKFEESTVKDLAVKLKKHDKEEIKKILKEYYKSDEKLVPLKAITKAGDDIERKFLDKIVLKINEREYIFRKEIKLFDRDDLQIIDKKTRSYKALCAVNMVNKNNESEKERVVIPLKLIEKNGEFYIVDNKNLSLSMYGALNYYINPIMLNRPDIIHSNTTVHTSGYVDNEKLRKLKVIQHAVPHKILYWTIYKNIEYNVIRWEVEVKDRM
ncbi:MAG: hypothetical protein FH753_18615 [Firmicutes bacterium]|nr:hypothetical protein [Bacillota bacterium]